jgi:outer membrane beta-barrel protein
MNSQELAMKTKWKMTGVAALGALALYAVPASAQEASQEVHVYGGELFGDKLTDTAISGTRPELDDDVTYGVRYGYNFSDVWGLELSVGNSSSSVTKLAGGDIDLDLTTVDVDAIWNIQQGSKFVPYLVGGAGYARANLDRPIIGAVNGQPVRIDDDSSFTLNAGIGAKYYVNDRFLIRLEARYRYLDKVLDNFDNSLNTVETTLGVGWRF